MRVAFISYEYPPETADGGIATYVRQAAEMLVDRGHEITVFCGDRAGAIVRAVDAGGVKVHRLPVADRLRFADVAARPFAEAHAASPFDVLEGPEFLADARGAVSLVPDIPLLVRLHISSLMIRKVTKPDCASWDWFRGWRRAIRARCLPPWCGVPEDAVERSHVADADVVTAPSHAAARWAVQLWHLPRELVVYPHALQPDCRLLMIDPHTNNGTITFVGRLEAHKGVFDLATALRAVVRRHPYVRVRFVGEAARDSQERVLRLAGRAAANIEFVGRVPLDDIPRYLAETDIAVLPSRWEHFGLACLEAMSAARGVIAGMHGGTAEMITSGVNGLLVPPRSPRAIAAAIQQFMDDPIARQEMGVRARQTVLDRYAPELVAPQQESAYLLAIERRRSSGRRMVRA